MALGTITRPALAGSAADYVEGNKDVRVRDVQLTAGANYTTGGETITASSVSLARILTVKLAGGGRVTSNGANALALSFDYSGAPKSIKVQAYRYDGASAGKAFLEEVAAGVDLSTFSARLEFTGV